MATRVTQEQDVIKKAKEEIEKRTGKTPAQLLEEREKRITDTIALKETDRVPVCLHLGNFPAKYAGLTTAAQYYDAAAFRQAIIKTLTDFEADVCWASNPRAGLAAEILGSKQSILPKGNLRLGQDAQFLDMDIMKENEYDLFIADPGDFILRYYLPRAFESLAPLAKLPPLQSLVGGTPVVTQSTPFSSPEVIQAFGALAKAGQEQGEFSHLWGEDVYDIVGIPRLTYPGGLGQAPFDTFVSYLRGMRATLIDMFKRPEKLLAAMEKVLDWRLITTVPPDHRKRRVHAGGNHFQSEEFLSRKQFDTFVWPSWKKSLLSSIDLGFVPQVNMEGKNDDRIDQFLELPKGRAIINFEKIDMAEAKAILGSHLCIAGNVPGSLLWGGSSQEVEEYCKNLIKICGKGGGYILDASCGLGEAKPANVKAMVDSVKKYGRYD